MSGETVTGKALQFTNDNKHAYAYSGSITVDNNVTTLLKFITNSSYVIAKFQPQYFVANAGEASEDYRFVVKFNNIAVSVTLIAEGTDRDAFYNLVDLIIPPNTIVEVTAQNTTDSNSRAVGAIVTGKVGMAARVGNLDE